ncbi:hypothetical protein [Bacteroides caccae]|jgi:hypothetical protein|uniref:Uncharacterized protein n=2 Tax=Bacteroides TaxID=816 RepID=A0A414FN55_9BACE|nr:hypothetical protein DW794_06685 [Bacteroides caccae]
MKDVTWTDMKNKNYDLKLAGYIWSILKTQPIIVMSWGVDMDTIKPVKGGLEFHVQGFKHTGMVRIVLDEGKDLFEIYLIPDSEGEKNVIEDVYFDMLVSVIDENVERTDDYDKRISDTYNIIRY